MWLLDAMCGVWFLICGPKQLTKELQAQSLRASPWPGAVPHDDNDLVSVWCDQSQGPSFNQACP